MGGGIVADWEAGEGDGMGTGVAGNGVGEAV